MKGFVYCLVLFYVFFANNIEAHKKKARVLFYNTENLFDTINNPQTNDDAFLPNGDRHWNQTRYYKKLHNIAQVLSFAGEWETPMLIGLCEIENDSTIYDLLHKTQLRTAGYKYFITTGNDLRGINVALLYQQYLFKPIQQKNIRIKFRKQDKRSRDILQVSGLLQNGDTLDVFVVHFPSKYGGEKETMQDREDANKILFQTSDSIYHQRQHPHLLIMGDFNEEASKINVPARYVNLMEKEKGSHKYHDKWNQIDQIIINKDFGRKQEARVLRSDILLKTDKTWGDKRPFRTFHGFKYEGGYSDHLPILADFYF